MDRNTELLLQKAARMDNWEDQEKATNDLEALREEFQSRLYARPKEDASRSDTPATSTNGKSASSKPE